MLQATQIQELLPHRYPFLLVDRVVEIEEGLYLRAYKNITINEEVFQGHFPQHPIYPGVMIIEGMAQASGILAFHNQENPSERMIYFLGIDKAKFRKPVSPGDKLEYEITVKERQGDILKVHAKATVDKKIVAEAELMAMVSS